MNLPSTREQLQARCNAGEKFNFHHFWGHTPAKNGKITQACFSQWYLAGFEVDGVHYPTAEHYMMAAKAKLFHDHAIFERVLAAKTPNEAKALGRKVAGYDEKLWLAHRFAIVCAANLAKFQQNPELGAFLLSTGESVIVEASPVDAIWGIGMAADHPHADIPAKWRGLNLLGFALMETRRILLEQVNAA